MKTAGYTPPFKDDKGKPLVNSIAEAKYYRLGGDGIDQYVLIRGVNMQDNPLVIMLHGGPGISETAFWRHYNSNVLEQYFTVVYWDQRGSGKSYKPREIPKNSMTIEQFLNDLDQLVDIVRKRCNKTKVVLFGHSWGSVLGPLYAQKHPEKVLVYVGCAQIGDWAASEQWTYKYVLELAEKKKNRKAVKKLKNVGPPPHDVNGLCTQRSLLNELDDEMGLRDAWEVLCLYCTVPEVPFWGLFTFWKVIRWSIGCMWSEVTQVNLNTQVPELEMPCFFFLGKQDHCVHPQNSQEYVSNLEAPSKQIVWFEESKHLPFMDEPDLFNKRFVALVRPVAVEREKL